MGRCEVSNVQASTHPLLTSICRGTCFVWGVGVMTECTHMHAVPPLPSKWRTTDISSSASSFLCGYTTQDSARALKWTTSSVKGDSMISKQHSREGAKKRSQFKMKWNEWSLNQIKFALPRWHSWLRCEEEVVVRASFETHPCTHSTVFCFIVPSAGQPLDCVPHTRTNRNTKDCSKRRRKQ